jgi:hypothetical protein
MRRLLLLCGLASIFVVSRSEAQKNCRKGIPCGNTCISRDKVCRIGTAPAPSSSAPAARALVAPANPAPVESSTTATDSEYPWVGSFADGIFFRATCTAAQDLAPANRRYFRTAQDAEGAGFRRSRTPGC